MDSFTSSTGGISNCLVPSSQLVSGGPGRDGIPALTNPRTVSAAAGDTFLSPTTLVLGVTFGGEARAYPHNVFWWHEIVNDVVGGRSLALSYCPLFVDPRRPLKELVLGIRQGSTAKAWAYGTLGERTAVNDAVGDRAVVVVYDAEAQMAIAFSRDVAGSRLSFDIVEDRAFPFHLRDADTGTLWDLTGTAVSGPRAGSRLEPVATYSAMCFAWAAFNRNTELFAQ